MDTSTSGAEKVTGLLQTLRIDPHASIQDTFQVVPNSIAGTQGGLDPSRVDASEGYGQIESGIYYTPNGYPPSHGYYLEGYDYATGDGNDYRRHRAVEAVEPQGLGSLNENTHLIYHPSGFAYNPQHIFGGQDHSHNASHEKSYFGNAYRHSGLLDASMITSSLPSNIEALKKSSRESFNKLRFHIPSGDHHDHLGARPAYAGHSSGFHGRVLPISAQIPVSQDVRVGYEGSRIGAPWFRSSKVDEGQQLHGLSSSSIFGQYGRPLAPLLPNVPSGHTHRSHIPEAASSRSSGRESEQSARNYSGSANLAQIETFTGLDSNGSGHHWCELEKEKLWSRGVIPNNRRLSWDIANEQNKGPRTVRGRQQRCAAGAARCLRVHDLPEPVSLSVDIDQFNRPDFVTTLDNAKFFIIKSYSEDDIHKSIKYSIWASTANGNKKLDAAYREAQASSKICPLFLFFSVNASGQFCGVAEMVGSVDFNSSLDFWQQDKWTGKVPLKWHIVKDVPNSLFRHIVLENNDNKPVTNSRDTQEVPLTQGSEMLNIFKTHGLKTSILDDFLFYETKQRFMQEKKARQQTHQLQQANCPAGKGVVDEKDIAQSLSHSASVERSVNQLDSLSKSTETMIEDNEKDTA